VLLLRTDSRWEIYSQTFWPFAIFLLFVSGNFSHAASLTALALNCHYGLSALEITPESPRCNCAFRCADCIPKSSCNSTTNLCVLLTLDLSSLCSRADTEVYLRSLISCCGFVLHCQVDAPPLLITTGRTFAILFLRSHHLSWCRFFKTL
jgi:hypothetical protein